MHKVNTTQNTTKIKLRYIPLDGKTIAEMLLLESANPAGAKGLKDRALEKLGIKRENGESHVDAWLRYLCELNDLPFQLPVPRELRDAIESDLGALRFMFFLAG